MVVIDSSVIFKWFVAENEGNVEQALKILENHLNKTETIIVPELLIYEVTNSWATKSNLTLSKIKVFLKDLENSNLQVESITFKLINKVLTFSKKHGVSVYDATYAVLAKEKKCDLITADNKFVDKVKLSFVKKLEELV